MTQSKKTYAVLAPIYYGTGRHFTSIDRYTGRAVKVEWQAVDWELLGYADTMEQAKHFHPHPVLHVVDRHLAY